MLVIITGMRPFEGPLVLEHISYYNTDQVMLGQCYRTAEGVERDAERAFRYTLDAASKGVVQVP